MDLCGLKYSKSDGSYDLRDSNGLSRDVVDDFAEVPIEDFEANDYQKSMPLLSITNIFAVSGGTTRERIYLEQFRDAEKVSVVFVSQPGTGLIPEKMRQIVGESIDRGYFIDYYGREKVYLDGDYVFLLQDVDHFGKELVGFYLQDLLQNRYRWIVSNPSIEVWLYYHYFADTNQIDYAKYLPTTKRSSWLKNQLNEIVPGGVNPKKLLDKMLFAVANAKVNCSYEGGFPSLFATEMYVMIETILAAMKDEFAELVRRREEKARWLRDKYSR